MKFELKCQFQIESARYLPHLPEGHPCRNMHGHSFQLIFTLAGPLEPKIGWVQDYHEIQERLRPLLQQLDHRVLNEVQGLENPTSELLAKWLFEHGQKALPLLIRVSVRETQWSECSYPA